MKNFNSGVKEDDIRTSSFETAQPHKLIHVCNLLTLATSKDRGGDKAANKRKNLQFYLLPRSFFVHHVFFFPASPTCCASITPYNGRHPPSRCFPPPLLEWGSMCVLYTSVLRVRACRWRTCGCIQQHHGEWPSACCFLWGCEIIPMAEWGVVSPWETHINCTASPHTHL